MGGLTGRGLLCHQQPQAPQPRPRINPLGPAGHLSGANWPTINPSHQKPTPQKSTLQEQANLNNSSLSTTQLPCDFPAAFPNPRSAISPSASGFSTLTGWRPLVPGNSAELHILRNAVYPLLYF